MRILAIIAALVAASAACAQGSAPPRPAFLMDGLSSLHHPVSTKNPEAQKFFDQGYGLAESLTRQNRTYEASWIKQQFETAWQGADVTLKVEDL